MVTAAAASAANDRRLGSSWRTVIVPFAVCLLVLTASLANFLSYHAYPLMRPEVALVVAGILVSAAAYSGLYTVASPLGRAAAEGLLVMIAIDLNSDVYWIALIFGIAAAAVRHRSNISILPPLAIVAAVVLTSSILGLSSRRPPIQHSEEKSRPLDARLPALVHIILDEHGGIAGLNDDRIRAELSNFYVQRGFRLFERAYSPHFRTANAVPSILNYGSPGQSVVSGMVVDVGPTAYLQRLARRGYSIKILQSEFAELCRTNPHSSCMTYWSPSLNFVDPMPFSTAEKARLIALKLLSLSQFAVTVSKVFDLISHQRGLRRLAVPNAWLEQRAITSSLAAFAAADRLESGLRQLRPGEAYFAHLLVPHYPYIMTRTCRPLPRSQWLQRQSAVPIAEREAAYHEQLLCLKLKLGRALDALSSSAAGKNAIVILHGDHGSRIVPFDPTEENQSKLSSKDMLAGYSTLLAVRMKGVAPGLDQRMISVPDFLRELDRNGFGSLDEARQSDGRIFLDGSQWTVGRPASIAQAWPRAD